MKLDENERSTQVRLMKVKDMMLKQAGYGPQRGRGRRRNPFVCVKWAGHCPVQNRAGIAARFFLRAFTRCSREAPAEYTGTARGD